jgi:hypothetical protein
MKMKRLKAAFWVLGTIFFPVTVVRSLFKSSIWTFFHFGILTQKVYIPLSGEYTLAIG